MFLSHFYSVIISFLSLSLFDFERRDYASVLSFDTAIVSDPRRCKKIGWASDTNARGEAPAKMVAKGQVTLSFEALQRSPRSSSLFLFGYHIFSRSRPSRARRFAVTRFTAGLWWPNRYRVRAVSCPLCHRAFIVSSNILFTSTL